MIEGVYPTAWKIRYIIDSSHLNVKDLFRSCTAFMFIDFEAPLEARDIYSLVQVPIQWHPIAPLSLDICSRGNSSTCLRQHSKVTSHHRVFCQDNRFPDAAVPQTRVNGAWHTKFDRDTKAIQDVQVPSTDQIRPTSELKMTDPTRSPSPTKPIKRHPRYPSFLDPQHDQS